MSRPNILFFLADDLGWADLGCYGSSFHETPNIDALRQRGMLFTDAYAACPVCSPTRASVLTGKYPASLGVTDWIDWGGSVHPAKGRLVDVPYIKHLPAGEHTLAQALASGGYATWHLGKWHLGGAGFHPEDFGFEKNIGGCHMGSPAKGGYFSPWDIEPLRGANVPEGTYLTDYLTDRAVELIESKEPRKPFFLNMWYYLVHTPIEAPEALVDKYREKARRLGLDQSDPFEEGALFPCEHKNDVRIRRRVVQSDPVYAAMVEKLDESVGRILLALRASGEEENTIVVFTSDNGGLSTAECSPTCNAPLSEGKGWMYDGGVREPLIMSWPGGVAPGSSSDVPVTSPDFYPTLLEAVGLKPPARAAIDGTSIVSLLVDRQTEKTAASLRERPLFWHYPHYGNQGGTPGSSIRKGDWKLLHFFEDDGVELYNLRSDIGEEHDRSAEEPALTEALKAELEEWRERVGALIPEENPGYTAWPGRARARHKA